MVRGSDRWVTLGAIVMTLIVGIGVAIPPVAAHDGDQRHCHVTLSAEDAKDLFDLTKVVASYSTGAVVSLIIETFQKPVGYTEAPWEMECHGGTVSI